MRTVNIADLKARLSAHIRRVRAGEEVLVCDRNKPVARIIPCGLEDYSEQEQRLIARGVLTPPVRRRRPSASWPKPAGNIPDGVMDRIWEEEREGR
ncbi:MAG TPA: type II toxin-antitoxin system prevent-host-death family antitoxin [Candidatus Binatus sp.]|nr:type II toxin-antitoxin system prevent-host-death family antitoxin [Candidatus Binatus sp.]